MGLVALAGPRRVGPEPASRGNLVARGAAGQPRNDGYVGLGNCCEPAGSIPKTHWSYVGDGRGGYEKVQSYEFVGEGAGSFEKETTLLHYGLRPRGCCLAACLCLTLLLLLLALLGFQHGLSTDWRSWVLVHHQITHHVVHHVDVDISGSGHAAAIAGIARHYSCRIPEEEVPDVPTGRMAICAAALLEAVWKAADHDGDGRISRAELTDAAKRHVLSLATIQVLKSGDGDGDGTLDLFEFAASLCRTGLASRSSDGKFSEIVSTSVVESAWLAIDKDASGEVTSAELNDLKRRHVSNKTLQILMRSDANTDGTLSRDDFEAGLSRCGLSSFVVSHGSRSVINVAAAEAAWVIATPNGGTVGKQDLHRCEDNELLPPEALRALWLELSVGGSTLNHGQFVGALNAAHLSGSFLQATSAEPVHHESHHSFGPGKPAPVAEWSPAKRLWCCSKKGVACPSQSTTHPVPFHCQSGLDNWQVSWTPAKKKWCCERIHVGCEPYDCLVGLSDWQNRWTFDQKRWCCIHTGRGCPPHHDHHPDCHRPGGTCDTLGDAQSKPFECNVGYSHWQTGWSEAKKRWCCRHEHRGCGPVSTPRPTVAPTGTPGWPHPPVIIPTQQAPSVPTASTTPDDILQGGTDHPAVPLPPPSTSSRPFDCDAGFANWEEGWSMPKKDYCCQHFVRGCPSVEAYNCLAGFSTWSSTWAPAKKRWCCQHHGRGCEEALSSPPFDCNVDYQPCYHCLEERWSVAKRDWCCKHASRGCTTTTSAPFDCNQGIANWEHSWALPKKAWCCQNQHRGCPEPPSAFFNCDEGFDNWQTKWPPSKKAWCCEHHQRGCPMSTSLPFDCNVDYTTCNKCLLKRWSPAKRAWCCQNQNRGCLLVGVDPGPAGFDCDAGYARWENGWSIEKKAWCCQHKRRGCPSVETSLPFDCRDSPVNDPDRGWSHAKRAWCCTYQRLGCNG